MKKLLITAALTVSSLALAGTWEIDPEHASALFTVRHMMVTNVTGRLGTVTGKVELDDKDISKSKVDVSIDVKGLNTNVEKRDAHLRSADFFDADKFPTVTFKATKIEKADKKLKVTGDLTIRGTTKPVTLDAEVSEVVKNPWSSAPTRAVQASATINREDWGLTWNSPMANNGVVVGKEVKIALDVELREAAPAAPAKKK